MLQQPDNTDADNTDAFNQQVQRYDLTDSQGTTEIVFFPQTSVSESGDRSGGPQLIYQGPEGRLIFAADEIYQQLSFLGLLITVVPRPDLDTGQLNLTLVLPPISPAARETQEFVTTAIKTRSQGHVIAPGGATLAYEVLMLKGVAEAVVLPLTDNGDQAMNVSQPMQKILEITEIRVTIFESFPVQLQVSVLGTVPATGWSNPQLIPYTYVQAPPDGIYDFDFVATPPKDILAPVISPIQVRTTLPGQDVKGIRVHASLNCKEFLLNLEDFPCVKTQAI